MDRGRGYGDKGGGAGGGGKGGLGTGEERAGDGGRGAGVGKFWGRGYTKICCILPILLYFYVLKCNNWVSGISNRRIKVNSGIFNNESDVDFTSPTRSVPPTAVYIEFVYVRFRFISS